MSLSNAARRSIAILALAGLSACSTADPVTVRDFKRYTGVALCPAAQIRDLTTPEERDTTPGFSFHVRLKLNRTCAAAFERQLARVSPSDCASNLLRPHGCTVDDAYAASGMHTSIATVPIAPGEYDVRFWE